MDRHVRATFLERLNSGNEAKLSVLAMIGCQTAVLTEVVGVILNVRLVE